MDNEAVFIKPYSLSSDSMLFNEIITMLVISFYLVFVFWKT